MQNLKLNKIIVLDKHRNRLIIGLTLKRSQINYNNKRSFLGIRVNSLQRNKPSKLNNLELFKILNPKYKLMKSTFLNKSRYTKNMLLIIHEALTSKNINDKLKRKAQNSILSVLYRPVKERFFGANDKETIQHKGFDLSLVDSGQFLKSFKINITKKSNEKTIVL